MEHAPSSAIERLKLFTLKALRPPFKFLFILSHMRSGSTLLVHLLNSNREIAGYGETTLKYATTADFDKLLLNVVNFFGVNRLEETYVMDKLLQDGLLLNETILCHPQVYTLFLLRRPEGSLPSILNVYSNVYPKVAPQLAGGESEALQYYSGRLNTLSHYVQDLPLPNQPLFVTHDQLLTQSGAVFETMQNWLGVSEPFKEQYEVHQATGKPVTGDFSETIKRGYIVRDDRKDYATVSESALTEARRCFERCSESLSSRCLTISNSTVAVPHVVTVSPSP